MTDIFDQIQFGRLVQHAVSPISEFIEIIPCCVVHNPRSNQEEEVLGNDVSIISLTRNIIEGSDDDEESITSEVSDSVMDTVPVVDPTIKPSDRVPGSRIVSRLLKTIGLNRPIVQRATARKTLRDDISVDIGGKQYKVSCPLVKDAEDELGVFLPIRDRCLKEYIAIEAIIKVDPPDISTVRQNMEEKIKPSLGHISNSAIRRLMRIKMEIILLIHLINKAHDQLVTDIESIPDLFMIGQEATLYIKKPRLDAQLSWNVRACIPPHEHDVKPQLRGFDDLFNLVDYCFKPSIHVLTSKVNLLARVDQTEAAMILCDPVSYLINCIRYFQLSVVDLYNLFFCVDKQGRSTMAKTCPCGRKLSSHGSFLKPHPEQCAFSKFVRNHVPSLLVGDGYSIPDREALKPGELHYINSVIAKRLPSYAWVKQPNGVQRLEKYQSGKELQVIDTIPLSSIEAHAQMCVAKEQCGNCPSNFHEPTVNRSMHLNP